MIRFLIALAVVVAVAFLFRKRPSAGAAIDVSGQKQRAQTLTQEEQEELAQEARRLALAGYDRLSKAALGAGKSKAFAHEAGLLDAAYCVLANDDGARQSDDVRRAMQMETIPFDKLDPSVGRAAIGEYLVWRFFPDRADRQVLGNAIGQFVDGVFASDEAQDDRFVFEMIYANRYDWQRLAAEKAKTRVAHDQT